MSISSTQRSISLALVAIVILIAGYLIYTLSGRHDVSTDDAYISADITLVAPKISGHIAQVAVEDNQHVHAGQLLAQIEDADYQSALHSALALVATRQAQERNVAAQLVQQQSVIKGAQATLDAGNATLGYARQNADRYQRLLATGTGTADLQQKSNADLHQQQGLQQQNIAALESAKQQMAILQASLDEAHAAIADANATLEQAKLNLSYTRITAPIEGMVGQRNLREGAYVTAGTRLLAIVPLQQPYVVANYLETQLAHVQPGQRVDIKVDALPDQPFHGKVDSIAPASGVTFSPIAPDNATGNFTKVVQRLAVKITLDTKQPDLERLRVGMSVVPDIKTDN